MASAPLRKNMANIASIDAPTRRSLVRTMRFGTIQNRRLRPVIISVTPNRAIWRGSCSVTGLLGSTDPRPKAEPGKRRSRRCDPRKRGALLKMSYIHQREEAKKSRSDYAFRKYSEAPPTTRHYLWQP